MLREASDNDMPAILRWRNHPQVRERFFTTHIIGHEEHAQWWESVRADRGRRLYVYERHGTPSGLVTFDFEPGHSASWGFYLDVEGLEERGELLPAWLEIEREVINFAFDELGLRRLHGEMLADNTAVRLLHRRHGFTETESYVREVEGRTREVIHIELLAENRRLRRVRTQQ